jgi:hypothetical protein
MRKAIELNFSETLDFDEGSDYSFIDKFRL